MKNVVDFLSLIFDGELLEEDFSDDFGGLIHNGDVEPFEIDSTIAIFQNFPAILWNKFVSRCVQEDVIGIFLLCPSVVEGVEPMVKDFKVRDGSRVFGVIGFFNFSIV